MIKKLQRYHHWFWQSFKSSLIQGHDDQSFLDAAWLRWILFWTPLQQKKKVALWILSLSPHYFYRQRQEYQQSTYQEFVAGEEQRNRAARKKICELVLAPYLSEEKVVLDLGCGPGFLAKPVASKVKKVYACDLSAGALACANILNGASNIVYIRSDVKGYAKILKESLDLVYSFAVIQHLQENTIQMLFQVLAEKTRPDGLSLWQVQLENPSWRQEETWRKDSSFVGRFRYRYALHCFPRTESFFYKMAQQTGWKVESILPLSDLLKEPFDDLYHQHLLILKKAV